MSLLIMLLLNKGLKKYIYNILVIWSIKKNRKLSVKS